MEMGGEIFKNLQWGPPYYSVPENMCMFYVILIFPWVTGEI